MYINMFIEQYHELERKEYHYHKIIFTSFLMLKSALHWKLDVEHILS